MPFFRMDHRSPFSTQLNNKVVDVLENMNCVKHPMGSVESSSTPLFGLGIWAQEIYLQSDWKGIRLVNSPCGTYVFFARHRGTTPKVGVSYSAARTVQHACWDQEFLWNCGERYGLGNYKSILPEWGWSGYRPSFDPGFYTNVTCPVPLFYKGWGGLTPIEGGTPNAPSGWYLTGGNPYNGCDGANGLYQPTSEEILSVIRDGRDMLGADGKPNTNHMFKGMWNVGGANHDGPFWSCGEEGRVTEIVPNVIPGLALDGYLGRNFVGHPGPNQYVCTFRGTTYQIPELLKSIPKGSKVLYAKVEVNYGNLRYTSIHYTRSPYFSEEVNGWRFNEENHSYYNASNGSVRMGLLGKVPSGSVTDSATGRKQRVDRYEQLWTSDAFNASSGQWAVADMTALAQNYVDYLSTSHHYDLSWMPITPANIGSADIAHTPYEVLQHPDYDHPLKNCGVSDYEPTGYPYDDVIYKPSELYQSVEFSTWQFRNVEVKFQYPDSEKTGVVSYRNTIRCDSPT